MIGKHAVAAWLSLLLTCGSCVAATSYHAWDLGLTGWANSDARGINSYGAIAGNYMDVDGIGHPVVWNPNGSTTILSGDRASDVNDLGQVVGSTGTMASIWDSDGTRTDLPSPIGASNCHALGSSRNGWIAGCGMFPGSRTGVVIWSPEHAATGIWSDSPFVESYSAAGVNDSGVAVGSGTHGYSPPAAFVFTSSGGVGQLSGGIFGPPALAYAISDSGLVAGVLDSRVAVWNLDGSVTTYDLGVAYGINNAGLVVGQSGGLGAAWDAGVLTVLDPLPGMTSSVAYDVNDNGWIVGTSTDAAGNTHATLWRSDPQPMPEPSTIVYALMSGLGGLGALHARKARKQRSR